MKAKNPFLFILASILLAPVLCGCILDKKAETDRQAPVGNISADNSIGAPANAGTKPIKLLFVGDMMFDRYIRQGVEKHGGDYNYIFSGVKDNLALNDLVVGNLEGPITDKKSVSVGTEMNEKKNLVFSFDPKVGKALEENNIKLVDLGNNHILNQGEEGIVQTENDLDAAGVAYFGDTGGGNVSFLIKDIGGVKVGFVNYNYSIAGSFERAIAEIKSEKEKSNLIVVCPHWGTEYKAGDPGENLKEMAHQFIDAGADLIVGTHPHVVETSETYKGKRIYYSLGNFIFDQYFSPDTDRGLAVQVEINPKDFGMNFQETSVTMEKNGKTVFN